MREKKNRFFLKFANGELAIPNINVKLNQQESRTNTFSLKIKTDNTLVLTVISIGKCRTTYYVLHTLRKYRNLIDTSVYMAEYLNVLGK